ncbi:TPA: fimbria/pilus periplasmic chaperone [Citrobacter amalonaticus]|uniref:Fimbria/pilus periplasmic chaperone n=1 Tax=Citrobacter amalonaticus TaxID=35703 RepID=A0A9C7QPC8_CITAM|nr:fimbria/pilus periplasmic chaperone [Citrobacter amalonaticus]
MKKNFLTLIFTTFFLGQSHFCYADGIALGATRIIYPMGETQTSINVTNSNKKSSFLVQSWVSDAKGNKSSYFTVTPPLFLMKPENANVLRIMYIGPKLPENKETVFYFNNKAIPSVDKSKIQGNTLQIATQSVIKLFVRPAHLNMKASDAPAMLSCEHNSKGITINNPSPYYVSLVNFSVGGKKLPNAMLSPMEKTSFSLQDGVQGQITFQTMNDYGAVTPALTCKV